MESDESLRSRVPKVDELLMPTLKALKKLGGSASIDELVSAVIDDLKLSEKVVNFSHSKNDSRTRLEYRLAWARTYLKKFGLITNSKIGVWSLTTHDEKMFHFDPKVIMKKVREENNAIKQATEQKTLEYVAHHYEDEIAGWRPLAFKTLLNISPEAFERLCQRLLREAGFIQVRVTGRTGDGGIDGVGILKVGLISFPIVFQCKRYKGNVPSKNIRDFRGAMIGRAEKGLIITTGNFTRDAVLEANREGAPIIELIDGDQLVDLLKNYGLGIKAKNIESIEIDGDWFSSL